MNAVINRVGLTFDLRDTYLEAGYSEVETAEFDQVETIDSIENALQQLGYAVDRIGHVKRSPPLPIARRRCSAASG